MHSTEPVDVTQALEVHDMMLIPGVFLRRRISAAHRLLPTPTTSAAIETTTTTDNILTHGHRLRVAHRDAALARSALFLAIVLDMAFAHCLMEWLWASFTPDTMERSGWARHHASKAVVAVTTLAQQTVATFLGEPMGIKLNPPLAAEKRAVIAYLLDVWVGFAWAVLQGLCSPTGLVMLSVTSRMGLRVMAALVQDMLVLLTVHFQAFFVYSRMLHRLNLSVLGSTFRLFRGKKSNPLRCRTDSYDYAPDQLLFGTVLFAISLFVYPTVAMFHAALSILWATAMVTVSAVGVLVGVYHGTCAGVASAVLELAWGRAPGPPVAMYSVVGDPAVPATAHGEVLASPVLVHPSRPLYDAWLVGWRAADVLASLPDQSLVVPFL
eukprot:m.12088 g.12088  ORF g.12088 m.12088 type:complete len:381 (-) comp2907_c0_seq1:462-1604(-)